MVTRGAGAQGVEKSRLLLNTRHDINQLSLVRSCFKDTENAEKKSWSVANQSSTCALRTTRKVA